MEKALRKAGCRITAQRKAVLDYLDSTADHPSARQVFENVSKQCPQLSLATVYNTLGTLVKMGLIKVLEFEAMDNRHETNLAPHINLVCTICGKIEDFDEGVTVYSDDVREKFDFEVQDYRMEYYGLCAGCRSKTSEPFNERRHNHENQE